MNLLPPIKPLCAAHCSEYYITALQDCFIHLISLLNNPAFAFTAADIGEELERVLDRIRSDSEECQQMMVERGTCFACALENERRQAERTHGTTVLDSRE